MRLNGLAGRLPKRFRKTTRVDPSNPVAPNILDRNFDVDAPDGVWATDITYVRTHEGWLYLAVVLDLYSRMVVGWSMAPHMKTQLVLDALTMALGRRFPDAELLHHSDRGTQYTSEAYRTTLATHGITCSMSGRGNCYDNAVVESFFGTLKTELVHRHVWTNRAAAKTAIAEYIEAFYNRRRLHSALGYLSPSDFESTNHRDTTQAA